MIRRERTPLVVLGVATPSMGQEGTEEEIRTFLEENGYTYPVLMDTKASSLALTAYIPCRPRS